MAFYMDPDVYGNVTVGFGTTQNDRFRVLNEGMGKTYFEAYNQTGPLKVTATWTMPSTAYRTFREAWENPAMLCYGANWFTADLPLGGTTFMETCVCHFNDTFTAALKGMDYWDVSAALDVDVSPQNEWMLQDA